MTNKITRVRIAETRITPGTEEGSQAEGDRLLSARSIILTLIFIWGMSTYYSGKYGCEYAGLSNTADLPPPTNEIPAPTKPPM